MPRLIYTSSASVTLTPYLGKAPFAVVVNQTESKIKPAASDSSLIIPGYSVTKLRAERIVLGAHGTNLPNGTGATFHLITICHLICRIKWALLVLFVSASDRLLACVAGARCHTLNVDTMPPLDSIQ